MSPFEKDWSKEEAKPMLSRMAKKRKAPPRKPPKPPKVATTAPFPDDAYGRMKESARQRNADASRSGRDIGPPPPVQNAERREAGRLSFRAFCEAYFAGTFVLAWSGDHLKVISKVETAVLQGGLRAVAMPRGSGKTSLVECACIWAVCYGHREFVALIGSEASHAEQMLDSIKTEIETNDVLAADFPEVCYPIERLAGINNRAAGQLCEGERTVITWTQKEIILPTIKGSKASGSIIKAAGLTGKIRGMKHKTHDGRTIRPSLAVIDDPQTDESAASPAQTEKRERIISGAVLGLAGPGKKIAAVLPGTVIQPGDLVDNLLDMSKHPEWQGERTKLMYAFPTNQKLWDHYVEIRAEALRAGEGLTPATAFYLANRAAMDEGAIVAWPERFNPDEISAVQNAMNWRIQDERAFQSEGQNDPMPLDDTGKKILSADEIAKKLSSLARGVVSLNAAHLTAFIDCHQDLLYFAVLATAPDFTSTIIDYGAYPDQGRGYFTLRDARPTLASKCPATGVEGIVFAGLGALTSSLLGREWRREDGSGMRITRCMVDAGWVNDTVRTFCRQSQFAAILLASHGRFVGAKQAPISRFRPQAGERIGLEWAIKPDRAGRYAIHDHNHWASFVHARLATAHGDKGSLTFFGDKAAQHRMIADHLTAEKPVEVEAGGRKVDEWSALPNRDNHLFDCVVGAFVAASIEGAALMGARPKRKRVTLEEMKQRAQAGR